MRLAAILIALLAAPVAAQSTSTPAYWAFVGLGPGKAADSGFYASGIGAAMQTGNLLLIGRIASLDTKKQKRIQDVGLLAGAALRRSRFHLGAAAGWGVATDSRDSSSIALPIEAFASFHILRWAGIGARVFGSINQLTNFHGFTLMLQLGRLRSSGSSGQRR